MSRSLSRTNRRLGVAVRRLQHGWVVVAALAIGTAAADEPECSCQHATAVCVPYAEVANGSAAGAANDGKRKGACVYLVNAFNRETRFLQQRYDGDERAFVKTILAGGTYDDGTRKYARFFQATFGRVDDERVSSDGVLLLRAFGPDKKPLDFGAVRKIDIKIGETTYSPEPASAMGETRTLYLDRALADASLGDKLEVEVVAGDMAPARRYSWYRPRDGWVVDYGLAGLAFSWVDWRFRGSPESSIVPAMIEYNYRHFNADGRFYVFGGFALGPNLVVAKATKDGENKSGGDALNGLVGAVQLNLNGFQLGFGTRWAWGEGRFDPMVTLSITEALARGLGITDQLPQHIVGKD